MILLLKQKESKKVKKQIDFKGYLDYHDFFFFFWKDSYINKCLINLN